MSTSRVRRRALLAPSTQIRRTSFAAGLAAVFLALGAVASQAASNAPFVGTFYDQEPISGTVAGDYPCFDGQTGSITGVDTISGRYNNAPDFFHLEASETADYRIDFADGRYVVGAFSAHLSETANSESGVNAQKDTEATREQATVYAADGEAIGTVQISGTFHTTWTDKNADWQVDPGELTASVDRFRVTCPS